MSRIKRVNVRYGQIVFDLDDIDRIMEECWKIVRANKEFMAVLGDQKSGNNIEAPESLIRRIVREESGNGKGSTYNVTAQVNRRTLFDLVLEEGKVRRTVTGRNPFETV